MQIIGLSVLCIQIFWEETQGVCSATAIQNTNLSALNASSPNSPSAELFRLLFDLHEDATGSSSEDMGLGLCPIPEGCCNPADCSSVLNTAMIARIVASSTWDQGFEGALIRRRNKLCHFCLSCRRRLAACNKNSFYSYCTCVWGSKGTI